MPDVEELLVCRRFRVVRMSYRLADGTRTQREAVLHPGAVVIVPMTDCDHVCLIRNYRPTVGETLVELPAGTLESGEDPAVAARRELAEETGYRANRLTPLGEFYMSPGILNERMHIYVAEELAAGDTALERGEQIEAFVVGWDEAVAMALDGRIRDAKSIAAILKYDRLRS